MQPVAHDQVRISERVIGPAELELSLVGQVLPVPFGDQRRAFVKRLIG